MDPLYLLCLLNSRVLNEYIRRTVTGYKLLQPQLELEDIRALPIRRIGFTTHISEREAETARGIGVFESESLHSADFAELANFAVACLTGIPERSDVVHDVLVHLGRETGLADAREPKVAGRRRHSPPGTAPSGDRDNRLAALFERTVANGAAVVAESGERIVESEERGVKSERPRAACHAELVSAPRR